MRPFPGVFQISSRAVLWLVLVVGNWRPVPLFAETSVPQSSVQLSAPRGIFVDARGYVLVASTGNDRIVVLRDRPRLQLEETIEVSSLEPYGMIVGTQGGKLNRPSDVAVDGAGRVVVADTGNDLVKVYENLYDPRGYSVQVIRPRGNQKLSSPEGVTVDEKNHIIVFDTGNGRIQILSSDGTPLATISRSRNQEAPDLRDRRQKPVAFLKAPIAGCCLGNGYILVADKGLPTYSVWKYDVVSPRSETCQFIGYGPPDEDAMNFYIRDMAYDNKRGCIACVGSNAPLKNAGCLHIRQVNPDDPTSLIGGDQLPILRIPLIGWLEDPVGVAFDPNGDLYISDASADSVQKINREMFASLTTSAVVNAQRTLARIEYVSTSEMPTLLEYGIVPPQVGRVGSLPRNYSDPEMGLAHSAQLDGLMPSTRYAYRYLLSRDFFCGVSGRGLPNLSPARVFATVSAHRTLEYLDFPLTVLVFTKGASGAAASGSPPSPTEQQLEDIRLQLEQLRLFFWVNSRMTCNVRPSLVPIKEPAKAPLLPGLRKGGGEVPALADLLPALKQLVQKDTGRSPSSLGNIFIIAPPEAFDPEMRKLLPITFGLDHLGGAASILAYPDAGTWSLIREYYKHLSITHIASGKNVDISYLLKDPNSDRTWVVWDSIADLARAIGTGGWLANQYGTFKTTDDDDEDGVPDDEPDCPLDEKRFGTSTTSQDTDSDRVSDLAEILASRWAEGFPIDGERTVQGHPEPTVSTADSDADGIPDVADKNPLCRLDDSIPKLDVAVDGKISPGEWEKAPLLRIADPEFSGVFRVAWTATHLCFSLTGTGAGVSAGPPAIRIRLDAAADGFLRGSDNLTLLFEPGNDGSFKAREEQDSMRSISGVPETARPWQNLRGIVSAWNIVENSLQLEIGLPKSSAIGLNLFDGKEMRFDFELRPAKSSSWLRVFEPRTLFRGVLTQVKK